MKKLGLFLLFTGLSFVVTAQMSPLVLQSEGGKLYLNHTVAARENWYSVGRIYNISPKELAPYNGRTIDKGLELGESLKVPMTSSNFAQTGTAAADEVFIPLYHIVSEKEGLYRIGQNFNKVKVEDLKAWNGLKTNDISNGQKIVVGYLRVKKTQSPLAVNGLKKIGPAVPALEVPSQEANAVTRNEVKPADTKAKDTIPAVTKQNEVTTKADNTTRGGGTAIEGSGYFKSVYLQQYKNQANLKVESGQAAIFKSTSGWQDAKYYALMSSVTPGTIIRISNPANSKAIFAKVLGELPPGKENEGLLVRISNAAAAELMVNEKETKFMAEVAYVKN